MPPLPPRSLTMSRRRSTLLLLLCLTFVAVGAVVLFAAGEAAGLLAMIFFGIGALVILGQVVRPDRLDLTAQGMTLHPSLLGRRTTRHAWASCSPFRVIDVRTTLVGYSFVEATDPSGQPRTRTGALQPGFDGLTAQELAALLNAYRDTALRQ